MFNKTLAAMAVVGALATSSAAFAADVTLYGLVDFSLNYQYRDTDSATTGSTDQLQLMSGSNSGSRFGIKGSEEIAPGFTAGFVLENGFNADTGALSSDGRIFDREAQAYLKGSFGTVSVGRMGQLASANGTYGLLGVTSPFSSGWGDATGVKYISGGTWTRYDNMVTLASPEFAGVQLFAQYSFKDDGKGTGDEGHATADRYYGIGAQYKLAGLTLVGVVDSVNYGSTNTYTNGASTTSGTNPKIDDSLTVTVGGNYNFDVAQVYLFGQYFDNVIKVGYKDVAVPGNALRFATSAFNGAEGYSVALGVGVPAFGGTAKASLGYLDADSKTGDLSLTRYNAAVGYDYQFTKRTSFYSAVSYTADTWSEATKADQKPSMMEVQAGLIHKF